MRKRLWLDAETGRIPQVFGPDSEITVLGNIHAGKCCVSWHRNAHGTASTAMKVCEFLHVIFTSVFTFIAV
jgi:hypothetical protein